MSSGAAAGAAETTGSKPVRRSSFEYNDLLECAHGRMFGPGNARLPLPPMLMVDRITHIAAEGGAHGKGHITAEFDIKPDLWFFPCHFESDPVMPGCLGVDALWQLTGFYLGWMGGKGRGRALGVGEVVFKAIVTPAAKRVTYQIDYKRVIVRSKLVMGIGDGLMSVDGVPAYEAKDLRVVLVPDGETLAAG
jgi:3-hydroxyacyl-[acyl-carrier protein] dehydratase / trans-2-decenoyl-[acyl-carrier protein] isomerase